MLEASTLIGNVTDIASSHPQRVFAKVLSPRHRSIEISYADLVHRASQYASMYRDRGVKENDVVVIIHDDTEPTIYAFVGALLHGAIPSIFAHPSVKVSPAEYTKTLSLLLAVCRTRFLLTYKVLRDQIDDSVPPGKVDIMLSDDASRYPAGGAQRGSYPEEVVLLQHSSGTTGLKKGVALSNASVVNQLRHYAETLQLNERDKIASWLPLYHDMGLIACFTLPLASGVPLVFMSPFDWIANPTLLLRAIHDEKCTLCWMPNFAYNFLASRVTDEDLANLDLSSMRAFINCAEPISSASHQSFYDRFRGNGVRQEILCTCYAMAENTFAVSQGGINEPVKVEILDANALRNEKEALLAGPATVARQTTVSSGRLIPNNHVRIVDDQGKRLPERRLGEIVIQSDSMLREYYNRPDLTAQAIKDGWYYTGDLGYLADGELFVLGRIKDLIIVAGKNIYPQDIEEIVSGIEGVYPGRVVAFGMYNEKIGTEDVVILAETIEEQSKHLGIKLAVAKAVREQLECVANEILLLPHMWLTKSSSGKISRPGNREKYLKELRAQ
jgi:acyl-CoA synthetase (AMP-forming)/AMP-acid ligase II